MRARPLAAAFVTASVLLLVAPGTAAADDGWAADAFVPAERGSRWFYVESLDLRGHGRMALGAMGTYAYRPVAVRDDRGRVIASPVRNQAVLHTGASFVFRDRIRLGFDVPLQIVADGRAAVVDGVTYAPAADETAVGDVRLACDVRLFGRHAEGLTGAIGLQLFVPSGSPASFTGDGEPHVRPRFMLAYERTSIALAATTGVHLRGRDEPWAGGQIGSEVFVGIAGGVLLAHKRISIGPELVATTVVSAGSAFQTKTTPVEALLSTRWEVLPKIRVGIGAGVGLTHAYGAPVARGLFALEWVPDDPQPPPPPASEKATPPDRDGDGVPDADDACGFVPGERSEFPERNGCPPP
ncbi:MAG: Outer rane lipoprotein omp16 precursor [Labilithrix sp.]|nr:Outer rane lipoprotein omp16 precursor [Labilithrix sp.]